MKISAHVILKNEARFAWYSIMSVLPYVDRIRIWDTGSTDNTLEIIEEIKKTDLAKSKEIFQVMKYKDIKFNEAEYRQKMLESEDRLEVEFPMIREMMLEQTTSEWFIILDADEIWWDDSIKSVVETIKNEGNELESIVVPTVNMVGDMFHYQEKEAGRYHLAGRVGHYNLRAINRKIPGLHGQGEHGIFMWADDKNVRIERRSRQKIKFINAPYMHVTHLQRSSNILENNEVFKRSKKLKHELGIKVPKDYFYPEVFFRPRPSIVPSIWKTITLSFKLRSAIETPLRKIYRRTILKYKKHGY